jgi:hypothetical protein
MVWDATSRRAMECFGVTTFIFTGTSLTIFHQGTARETVAFNFSCSIKTTLIFTATILDQAFIC